VTTVKIVYFIGAYGRQYDANEIHYELGREFTRAGHTAVVFAPSPREDLGNRPLAYQDGEVAVEHCLVDDTRLRRMLLRLSSRLFHYPHFLPALIAYRRFLRRHPDAAVVHADMAYPIGAIAALAGGRVPIVASVHGGDVIGRPDYGYARFRTARLLTRLAFRRAALVRINSPLMAELAQERGCPPGKVRLLLVNIGDRFFRPGEGDLAAHRCEARARVLRELGLPGDAFLLLSLGRLIPLKGVEEVVRAAAAVRDTLPQARTIIAGPSRNVPGYGDYGAFLKRLAAELDLAERVVFVGPLGYEEAVPRYLAAADLFLSPSHLEGLNRVVAEAGALGTPSIVSQGTGVAPLVQELGAGIVVPVGDVAALAGAVARLAADAQARADLAQRSQLMARRFSPAAVAAGLLALYEEAIASQRMSECASERMGE
jgi:glycosyltransferase involved in cell wall biosynthesis